MSKYSEFFHLPFVNKDQISANHLFILIFKSKKLKISRDRIIQKLYQKNIITQVHYIPINKHPFYKKISKENILELTLLF